MWVRTETGVAHIELRPFSLVQKAEYFETRIQMRHDRYGMVAPSELAVPGQLASSRTRSDDNDGLWTAMCGAAECFRYAATKSAESLERARRATRAILSLEHVTAGPDSRHDRTSVPASLDRQMGNGIERLMEHTSGRAIRARTRSLATSFCIPWPTISCRTRRSKEILRSCREDHGPHSDEPLRVGGRDWETHQVGPLVPEIAAEQPEGRPDAPLNAVELLSFLCVSHHVTGNEAYLREYRKLTGELHYPEIAARYSELREELNYSDEELAMLSFYPLLQYETDPALLTRYRAALDQWWANMRREENPLWTFIYLACNPAAAVDTAAALETLRNIPLDLVSWTVSNSHRRDIEWAPGLDRFGKREAATLLPADERPVMKWNGDPFVVDGGDGGRSEDDGTFFLLPTGWATSEVCSGVLRRRKSVAGHTKY